MDWFFFYLFYILIICFEFDDYCGKEFILIKICYFVELKEELCYNYVVVNFNLLWLV